MADMNRMKCTMGSYIGFSGETIGRFTQPQAKWCLAPFFWSLYRVIVALYVLTWFVLVLWKWGEPPHYYQADSKAKFLIYMSNWSYMVLLLYLILMAAGTIYYHVRHACQPVKADGSIDPELHPDSDGSPSAPFRNSQAARRRATHSLPLCFKFAWFLQSIAFSTGLGVTIAFFIPGIIFNASRSAPFTVYTFHIHGVNLIVILLEVFLSASPVRVLHLIYPSAFSLVYLVFTLIYFAVGGLNPYGGTAIYPDYVDWYNLPARTAVITAVFVFVAAPVLHLILYLVYRVRDAISKRYTCCCSH